MPENRAPKPKLVTCNGRVRKDESDGAGVDRRQGEGHGGGARGGRDHDLAFLEVGKFDDLCGTMSLHM